jgi:hypothetical protein
LFIRRRVSTMDVRYVNALDTRGSYGGIMMSDEFVMRGWRSLYEYADGNPGSLTDPSGLAPCGGRWRGIGGASCEQRTANPKPGYSPLTNGCSAPLGIGGGPYDFTSACDTHDICYGTCGADRYECDYDFWVDMRQICYGASRRPGASNIYSLVACTNLADAYYRAVATFGESYYQSGQDDSSGQPHLKL